MKYAAMMMVVMALSPSTLLAAEKPATLPPIAMEQLLQELRDMDTGTDMDGDHVVGEQMC
jgi:hypothetical protein